MSAADASDGAVRPAVSLLPAEWLAARLRRQGRAEVCEFVPLGFEAYVRLFHPIWNEASREHDGTWTAAAHRHGTVPHGAMQWPAITGVGPRHGDVPVREGTLPRSMRGPVREVLGRHTSASSVCLYAVWLGFGDMEEHWTTAPVLELPGREYALVQGPLDAIEEPFTEPLWDRSPNLAWPEDRSWFVATEVDFAWTYVGGSRRLCDDLLATPALEAYEVAADDRCDWRGDTINADEEPDPGR